MEEDMKEVSVLMYYYWVGIKSFLRKHSDAEETFKEQMKASLDSVKNPGEAWESNESDAIYNATQPKVEKEWQNCKKTQTCKQEYGWAAIIAFPHTTMV